MAHEWKLSVMLLTCAWNGWMRMRNENTWPSNGHVSNQLEGDILHLKPILLNGIEEKRERKGEKKGKKRRERKENIERKERKGKEGSCAGSVF